MKNTRLKELDVLRGFAALNVVFFHYTTKFRELFGHNFPEKYDWNYGHFGVELFFIISGFVIFMTLHQVKSVGDFAFKRFSRLYPTYWICLILTLVIISVFKLPGREVSPFEALINLTMIQGVFNVANIDGAYWSLIPELFFYGFMVFVYQFGWLNKIRIVAVLWLAIMILNAIFTLPFGAYLLNLRYGMFFLAGMLFYKLKFDKGGLTDHLLIGTCFVTALIATPTLECFYIFSLFFLLFYLFVYGKLNFLNFRPLVFLGYISYPLYLIHQNIGYVLMREVKPFISNEYILILMSILVMISIAWFITRFIEKPILLFLRNYNNQKRQDDEIEFKSLTQKKA